MRAYSAGSMWSVSNGWVIGADRLSILPSPLRQARNPSTILRNGAVMRHEVDWVKRAI